MVNYQAILNPNESNDCSDLPLKVLLCMMNVWLQIRGQRECNLGSYSGLAAAIEAQNKTPECIMIVSR